MSDYIPFALQGEIMKRLPTRSLLQFRTVSKQWKSLIDSSQFIVDYSLNHTHQQHLLVCYTSQEDFKEKYVSIIDDETFPEHKCSMPDSIAELGVAMIMGSSQGLFCLSIVRQDPRCEYASLVRTTVLWNPSIRKSVAIDTPHSSMVFGFGVCPYTSDPKLVKIKFTCGKPNLDTRSFTPWQVEVYTLSSGTWGSIPTTNQPSDSIKLRLDQVVINGFIYWLAIGNINISMMTMEFEGYNLIVSFDMASEKFMEISLPDTLARAPNCSLSISKLKEYLVVVEMVREAEKRVYGIWMMEHGVPNSFTKLFTINSPDASIRAVLGFRKNIYEPICAMRADYNVHSVFVLALHSEHNNYTLMSCNGPSHTARFYMESLLLLDH
ncbi:putative F-box domain-containing protein [Helianthus annuus]|nr:putative F-box domain-containing protein [Helianthus annuus]KAJ0727370.1 putative F-box domain-containing protein [Helianthus annuus]KAJ0730167.1 putative F-box domain-containing protein [Helianthus annuus]